MGDNMKFKALLAVIVLSMAAATNAHSFGLGAQANFSAGDIFAPGAALLISPSDMTNIAVNWYIEKDNTDIIGLTLDLVPLTLPIVTFGAGSFNFNLGAGLYANVTVVKDWDFKGGIRVPVGFNLLLGKNIFELFVHVAPSFGVRFLPSFGLRDPFFPIALGARLWFR